MRLIKILKIEIGKTLSRVKTPDSTVREILMVMMGRM